MGWVPGAWFGLVLGGLGWVGGAALRRWEGRERWDGEGLFILFVRT